MALTDTFLEPAPSAAFLTDDPAVILRFAADTFDKGQGSALVTLVDISGGAARALGAQMAVRSDGVYCGFVSGGCTEAAVAAEAVTAIQQGLDRYLRLGEGSRFFDIALPCGGGITLAIHVLRTSRAIHEALGMLELRCRVGIRYDANQQSICTVEGAGTTHWEDASFVRIYRPKTRIILCGRSIELDITVELARAAGYGVVIIDDVATSGFSKAMFDMDTAVVLLHHDLDRETAVLKAAFSSAAFYIGALGSKKTHQRRSEKLSSMGIGEQAIARVKAPIGLFPKARDAKSLALSILADIAAASPAL